ncbi:DUF6155 family protein [Paenibacillus sp. MBLB4367]|uniref:DUF6155 family protein n=1 Tax=Paenibacillus sp. MBLB4367 TaxID=3384767 RepID=UPI003907FFEA
MTYICTIELVDIEPKIWREFKFHPDVTFDQLHKIIQTVMGWEDYHLYEFQIGYLSIGLPDPASRGMDVRGKLNARKETVGKHLKQESTRFSYTYDLGDDWQHTITLVKIDPSASMDPTPVCLNGQRNCPREDAGGAWGHLHMLEVLAGPESSERDDIVNWLEGSYDPEHFSTNEVNQSLRKQSKQLVPKSLSQESKPKSAQKQSKSKSVKLSKSALNKHLKTLSQEQLIELVKACFDASKDMERFLAVRVIGEEAVETLFHEYRVKVEQEFFPERGTPKMRLQEAKKAIAEFQRLTDNEKYSFELKLIYVEKGVLFTVTYGDIDERFYYSMESVYADAIRMVNEDETGELFEEYKERLEAIVSDSEETGWGFQNGLSETYSQLRWI